MFQTSGLAPNVWLGELKNKDRLLYNYINYFTNVASCVFKWEGLPEGLRSSQLERFLFYYGMVANFLDDVGNQYILPLARGGNLNMYWEMTEYYIISPRGTFQRNIDNAVLFRNNEFMIPTIEEILPWVEELVDIQRAISVNRNVSAKQVPIFQGSLKDYKNIKRTYNAIVSCAPMHISEDPSGSQPARFGFGENAPNYMELDLLQAKRHYMSIIYKLIGVLSNDNIKQERVNVVETTLANGDYMDSVDSKLALRKLACEQSNAMFGTNLSVELNNDYLDALAKYAADGESRTNLGSDEGGADNEANNNA